MRFLKKKIARALELSKLHSSYETTSQSPKSQDKTSEIAFHLRSGSRGQSTPSHFAQAFRRRRGSSGNNIMKNYCRAMVNFGLSEIVRPYLINEAGNGLSYERYQQILNCKRRGVNCIKGLRNLLVEERRDSQETRQWKAMFQKCCEVFLKYFCVNWIFQSKVDDKMKHLRYRARLLRRVQKPAYFQFLG